MSLSGYQDIASAAFGANAGGFAPNFMENVIKTQNEVMWNEYGRGDLRRKKTRSDIDINLGEKQAYRALPGQFNQRGLLDSGQYQRGGRELAKNLQRIRGRADEDFQSALQGLDLSDTAALTNLEQYRGMLTPKQYQTLVAAVVGNAGGGA